MIQGREPRAGRTPLPDEVGPGPDVASDEVTLASWESFPASDPPGWVGHPRPSADEDPD